MTGIGIFLLRIINLNPWLLNHIFFYIYRRMIPKRNTNRMLLMLIMVLIFGTFFLILRQLSSSECSASNHLNFNFTIGHCLRIRLNLRRYLRLYSRLWLQYRSCREYYHDWPLRLQFTCQRCQIEQSHMLNHHGL